MASHHLIHPGEVLLEDFLTPMGITPHLLAQTISVLAQQMDEVVHGKRAITPETAVRLARALGTSDRVWINLQIRFDLDVALDQHGDDLDRIKPLSRS